MNTKHIIWGLAALMGSSVSLTSCQSEENFATVTEGREVLLTLTVGRGEQETRSEFTEVNGDLVAKWSAGDKLLVYNESKAKIGYLTIEEKEDGEYTAAETFSGIVTLDSDSQTIGLAYLGASNNDEVANYSNNYYEYQLGNQNGSFASMAANDCLLGECWAVVDDNGNYTVAASKDGTGNVTMERRLAFGHFKISGVDLKAGDKIVISGDNLLKVAKVNIFPGGGVVRPGDSSTNRGDITITLAETPADNDFYVTIAPIVGSCEINPTFTVITTEDKTYTSEALGSHTWKYGEYVHSGDANGTPKVVAVTAEEEEEEDNIEWVDLGLSVLWADRNIGASSPEDIGGYYCWAGVTPLTLNPNYNFYTDTYDTSAHIYNSGTVGYNILQNLKTLGILTGNSNYFYEMERLKGSELDVVSVTYGSDEYYTADTFAYIELINNCTFTYTTQNNISGWKATSNNNGKSIFFPASGYYSNGTLMSSDAVILRLDVQGCNAESSCFYIMFTTSWNKSVSSAGAQGYWNMFAPVRGVKDNN